VEIRRKIGHREYGGKMHLKRWVTGLIALPILIYVIGFSPRWIFYLLLFLASLAGLMEFYRIAAPNLPKSIRWSGYLFPLVLFLLIYTGKFYLLPAIIVLLAVIPMTLLVILPHSPRLDSPGHVGKGLLGPIYICLPLAMLVIMARYPQGNLWIFFLLAVIFANDTGAFYCGRQFGKHKLHESLSPGKTWEGAVGGVLSSIIAALWFLYILHLHEINFGILSLVVALSIMGQIGDLAESMLKRSHGVKDSGTILPGHGGVLDRIDGLLFAIPVLYIYFHFCVIG